MFFTHTSLSIILVMVVLAVLLFTTGFSSWRGVDPHLRALRERLRARDFLPYAPHSGFDMAHAEVGCKLSVDGAVGFWHDLSGRPAPTWSVHLDETCLGRDSFVSALRIEGDTASAMRQIRGPFRDALEGVGDVLWGQLPCERLRCDSRSLEWSCADAASEIVMARQAHPIELAAEGSVRALMLMNHLPRASSTGARPSSASALLDVLMSERDMAWALHPMRELLVLHADTQEAQLALDWIRTERDRTWRVAISGYVLDDSELAFQRNLFERPSDFAAHRMMAIAWAPEPIARVLAGDLVARFDAATLDRAERVLTARPESWGLGDARLLRRRVPQLAVASAWFCGALSVARCDDVAGALSLPASCGGALTLSHGEE